MISKSEQIQIHYEFAMSIGTSLDLHKMLRKSLAAILRKLNCPAGGVHFFAPCRDKCLIDSFPKNKKTICKALKKDHDGYQLEEIITIPRDVSHIEGYQKALAQIPPGLSSGQQYGSVMLRSSGQQTTLADFYTTLPLSGQTEDGNYSIIELPGLGVVVLLKDGGLDSLLIKSLGPVFAKLAVACRACLQNEELIRHQNNLQELVAEKTGELVSKNQQLTREIEHREGYEEALRKNEEKYRELVQNANSIILRWDIEGRVTFFNEYAQAFFGFTEDEIIGRHVVGTIVPESESTGRDLAPLMDDICKHPQKYEYNVNENMRKDGSRVWVAWTNKIMTDDRGELIGVLSIGADITEHKKITEALSESEKSLVEAQKIAHLGNWSWDIASNTLHWSNEIYRIFGVQPQEFSATYEAFLHFIHPDDREKVQHAVEAALYENSPYDVAHRIVLENGEERMVHEQGEVTFDQFGKPTRMVGIVQDITERNHSGQRFKLAAEAMSDLIYEWDIRDDTLRWFGDIDTALGYGQGEFPHTIKAWVDRIHPDDMARLADAVAHHRTSTDPISYEYRIGRKDGTWVYWSDYGVPVLDSAGTPSKWIGSCTDITEKKKAERQLIESEERYRTLFTNEIDAICIFEIETEKLIDVNDAWLKLYGYQRDEFGSLTIDDLRAELEATHETVEHSARVGTIFIPERHQLKKDGTEFVVELSAGPFTWKGQQLMYALARDITERKKAEDKLKESEQLLAETQKIAQLGSWEFDVVAEEIKWSTETFRIAGRQPKDKQTLQEYLNTVHPDDLPLLQEALGKSTAEKKPYEVELRHKRDDGSYNYTLTRGKPIVKDNEIVKFIGSVLDITERKQAEQELQRAKGAAESANKAKSAFLANMSHELRTPLNAILGFSELMTRDTNLSKAQQANLATIGRSGEHLLSLINDVLELSKIEAGQTILHQENFDLHRFLLGLEEMFHLRAQQKGLYLDFEQGDDVPRTIRADQSKLRQILINLLGNGVKFTETGGITLSVTNRGLGGGEAETGGCFLHFEVVDTGVGISRQEKGQIFDAFFQADGQQSSHQGTGLGLPISQKFVDLMDGELKVRSEAGKGTSFTFEIPVEFAGDADTESQFRRRVIALAEDQPVFRLLVVEDNENNRNLLVRLLRAVGFEVQEAINGQDAIEKWQKWQPHLVWMDIRMPVMDGYEATAIIKSEMRNAKCEIDTKIIALTASAFEEDRLKVIEHGGDDFVRKPFKESEIFDMLGKHLGVKHVYREEDASRKPQEGHGISLEVLRSDIAALPVEILARLAESTELSDAAMIDQVIKDIRTENAALADALSGLANNFAYDEILSLVQIAKTSKGQINVRW